MDIFLSNKLIVQNRIQIKMVLDKFLSLSSVPVKFQECCERKAGSEWSQL